jgi:hypothetical protein
MVFQIGEETDNRGRNLLLVEARTLHEFHKIAQPSMCPHLVLDISKKDIPIWRVHISQIRLKLSRKVIVQIPRGDVR